jgi:WD40 repeat protein
MRRLVLAIVIGLCVFTAAAAYVDEVPVTNSIDWSPDDQWIATTDSDNFIHIWNPVTGLVERELQVPAPQIFASQFYPPNDRISKPFVVDIEWDPSGTRLAFIVRDFNYSLIRIVDAATFDHILDITLDDTTLLDWISNIEWSPDGELIAGASIRGSGMLGDYAVRIWDTTNGNLINEMKTAAGIHMLDWHPNPSSSQLGFTSRTTARIWNVSTNDVYDLEGHTGSVESIAWNSDGSHFITRDAITVQLWDPESGQNLMQYFTEESGGFSSISALANSDQYLAQYMGQLFLVDQYGNRTSDKAIPLPYNGLFDIDSTKQRVALSFDSSSIIIYNISGEVTPFETATSE